VVQRDFPDAIQELYVWLLDQGFQLESDERGGMGGAVLVLSGRTGPGPIAWIEISGDRGHWVISLRFEGMSRYIAVQAWRAYIEGVDITQISISEQVVFVSAHLNDAAIASVANPSIEAGLVRIGEEYMRRKYPKMFGAQ
jgi:hypothetical protein